MKKIKKAVNGLQQIQAKEAQNRQLISQGLQAGGNALAPGLGTAIGVVDGLSGALKDENGLYKSKAGQALDNLNPVTAVSSTIRGIGQVFSGKKLDPTNQEGIRKQMELDRKNRERDSYFSSLSQDNASLSQLTQYKKGAKSIPTKPIEMEGGEPLFSKKVNGKRKLKVYEPNGKTHEQGGIPVLAAEGDAIVTAKKGLGDIAVAAHQSGDHATVEKIINKMPKDTASKKRAGAKSIKPDPKFKELQKQLNSSGYNVVEDGKRGPHSQAAVNDFMGLNKPILGSSPTVNSGLTGGLPTLTASKLAPVATPQASANTGKLNTSAVAQGLAMAPTLYNLGQGLFGKTDKTTRRSYNPELNTYEDLSAPLRRQSKGAMKGQIATARNLSGGVAGNLRSNSNQAYAEDFNRQQGIDSREGAIKRDITEGNTRTKNQAILQNNAMNNQADELDMQNAAKKSEALSKGLEGISALASNSILTKNTLSKEAADRAALGDLYKNFTIDENGKAVFRKVMRKGTKRVTTKK